MFKSGFCYQLNSDPAWEIKRFFQAKSQPKARTVDRHVQTHPMTGNQVTQSKVH